ncbi:hypothetical protein [Butyrivibrio proteoclasticus]|nr:hypothetical protein [Butyrivibrio proteoclasticus]
MMRKKVAMFILAKRNDSYSNKTKVSPFVIRVFSHDIYNYRRFRIPEALLFYLELF